MPSTSVQISMRFAPSPAPKMAAEKSEPPRPIVVVMPAAVRADEAAHHRNAVPNRSRGLNFLLQRSIGLFVLRDGLHVGAVRRQHLARINVTPFNPRAAKAAATILLESISPKRQRRSVVRGVSLADGGDASQQFVKGFEVRLQVRRENP